MKKRQMYIRMVTASLLRRRSRMVIALLAITIGALILSGLVTIYIDVPRQMGAQFRNYGANMILAGTGEGFEDGELTEALAKIPTGSLVGAAPYAYNTVRINDRPVLAAATSMEEAQKTSPFWAVEGAWPASDEEIMLGKNVAALYNLRVGSKTTCTFAPEAEGETVSSEEEVIFDNEKEFLVSGILDTGGKEEEYVYMTLNAMEELTGQKVAYDLCEMSVTGSAQELKNYAEAINASARNLNARLVKRVTESENTVLSKLQAMVLLVTIVVLALTMICVATTMTAVVAERRKEIGLRKALGASNGSIIGEFMGEGLVLGAVGGLLGGLLGFAFAQAVSMNVFNSSIVLKPLLLPLTILASVAVTGVACLIPVRSATDVDPALVLKGE